LAVEIDAQRTTAEPFAWEELSEGPYGAGKTGVRLTTDVVRKRRAAPAAYGLNHNE
jgi:hypothetical protein